MAESVRVVLKRGEEKDIYAGHLWIYDNEVERTAGKYEAGGFVDVVSYNGVFLGRGFINPKSRILVRLMTYGHDEINFEFLKKRLHEAFNYREKLGLGGKRSAYRAVYGEADLLPGLVVDKFADCFVIQTLALGIDRMKADIVEIIRDYYNPRCIYERNDVPLREKEGLPQQTGALLASVPAL